MNRVREKGFTITELLVVLTVFGLMMAVSVGNFQSVIRNHRLTGATNQLVTHMRLAREKSVAEGNDYIVTFRALMNNYQVWDDEGNDAVMGATDSRRTFEMPDGTQMQNPSFFGGNRVTFHSDGTCSASGTVDITNGELTKKINVLASTGKVTVTN